MVFWISLVPSPMSRNGASRISRGLLREYKLS
jgi:hypothetical protein